MNLIWSLRRDLELILQVAETSSEQEFDHEVVEKIEGGRLVIRLVDFDGQPVDRELLFGGRWLLRDEGHPQKLRADDEEVEADELDRIEVVRKPRGRLKLESNVINIRAEIGALNRWLSPSGEVGHFRRLLDEGRVTWPTPTEIPETSWILLKDDARDGVEEQRDFVRKALSTPDFCVLFGPPGSGKTTAICELVGQLVSAGRRVALLSQQHVAVDNVIEKLMKSDSPVRLITFPIRRQGRHGGATGEGLNWLAENLVGTFVQSVKSSVGTETEPSDSQQAMTRLVASEDLESLGDLLTASSNLECGTTSGSLVRADADGYDYVIIDEASLLRNTEFLRAALKAERWILVGDPQQLPPYSDLETVASFVKAARAQVLGDSLIDPENAREFRSAMVDGVNSFDLRRMPERSRRARERMMEKLRNLLGPTRADEILVAYDQYTRLHMISAIEALLRDCSGQKGPALLEGLPDDVASSRRQILTRQFRMHPEISALVRQPVYEGKAFLDASGIEDERWWSYSRYSKRAVWLPVRARNDHGVVDESSSATSQRLAEARCVANEVKRFVEWIESTGGDGRREWTIACISPYTRAKDALSKEVRSALRPWLSDSRALARFLVGDCHVEIAWQTVQQIQGREADLVFLSMGLPRFTSFTQSLNRMNVALTRARFQLVIVGNLPVFQNPRSVVPGEEPLLTQVAKSIHVQQELEQ